MAENQDGQEKSQEPTGKRVQDAREKGQVPRSRELNTMMLTLVGAIALIAMGSSIVRISSILLYYLITLSPPCKTVWR